MASCDSLGITPELTMSFRRKEGCSTGEAQGREFDPHRGQQTACPCSLVAEREPRILLRHPADLGHSLQETAGEGWLKHNMAPRLPTGA